MGASGSSARGPVFGRQRVAILVQGLDGAGKTTALERLCCGEVATSIPTVGFNVEAIDYKGRPLASITAWDDGSCDKTRPLWRHFYRECCALVYVVDSTDSKRLDQAAEQLEEALELGQDLASDWPVLVLANKQDAPGAMGIPELAQRMGLSDRLCHRRWHAQPCCALSGDGLHEAMAWLTDALQRRSRLPRLPSRREAMSSLACTTPRRAHSNGSVRSSWSSASGVEGKAFGSLSALTTPRGCSRDRKALGALMAGSSRRSSSSLCSSEGRRRDVKELGGFLAAARSRGTSETESTVDTEFFGGEDTGRLR